MWRSTATFRTRQKSKSDIDQRYEDDDDKCIKASSSVHVHVNVSVADVSDQESCRTRGESQERHAGQETKSFQVVGDLAHRLFGFPL
jgi:hypothetical protein